MDKDDLNIINEYKQETKNKIDFLGIDLMQLPKIVQDSWNQIFTISDDKKDISLGKNIFPKPQMMGYFLEVLIAKKFKSQNGNEWEFDPSGYDKDITNLYDDDKSIEIKTSSNPKHIYGNRSYAFSNIGSKKSKSSFYLAVNFEKFRKVDKLYKPKLRLVRFGYLDYSDWIPQKSPSGQQAHVDSNSEKGKLLEIWPNMDNILM